MAHTRQKSARLYFQYAMHPLMPTGCAVYNITGKQSIPLKVTHTHNRKALKERFLRVRNMV